MTFTDGYKLLEEVKSFRPDEVPRLMKATQLTCQNPAFLKWFKELDNGCQTNFIEKAVHTYCLVLTSTKLARAFLKLLYALPNTSQGLVEKEITSTFERLICSAREEDSHLKTLCVMLDQNSNAQKALPVQMYCVSSIIRDKLIIVTDHGNSNAVNPDMLYYTLKICILCLQLNPTTIKQALSQGGQDLDANVETKLSYLWCEILCSLLKLLLQGALSRDLLFLVGTAVAMEFNLLPSCDDIVRSYVGVINMLTSDQTTLNINSIIIDRSMLPMTDSQFPLLAIIKGMLVSASKDFLCHLVNHQPLLLFVFPHIMNVCQASTEYHYLAFQILLLWFEKLDQIGPNSLIPNTKGPEATRSLPSSMKHKDDDPTHLLPYEHDAGDNSNRSPPSSSMNVSSKESMYFQHLSKEADVSLTHPTCHDNGVQSHNWTSHFSADTPFATNLMSKSCHILSQTLSCLWLNWDSPVEGVSDFGVNIFQIVMKMWSRCVHDGLSDYSDLSLILMNRVMSMAWYTKTRYRPMSVVLSHLNSKNVLDDFPNLKDELLRCMAMNHMAAVASDVYKMFLQKVKMDNGTVDPLSFWVESWMDTLLQGLTSTNTLQRLKTCTYWLPPTLKIIPGSANVLLENVASKYEQELSSKKHQWLFAWITVYKSARDLLNMRDLLNVGSPLQHEQFIHGALISFDETVRSEVLMLICGTLKRAEPVSLTEIKWMKKFLLVNIKTDSAPFRQCLTSAIKKFIVRIRDSCLSALKSGKTSDTFLPGIEFIDWLYRLLMHSLAPGGSYQRRQTTLNILDVLFESLIYQAGDCSKKGKASENSDTLLKYAQEKGMWVFFSSSSFCTLLTCLEDGAEEIQSQSYKILMDFFHWPTSLADVSVIGNDSLQEPMAESGLPSVSVDNSTICHLFCKALELISSAKSYENHTGQLIMILILKKFITIFCIKFDFDETPLDISDMKVSLSSLDEKKENDPAFLFISSLVHIAQRSVDTAQKDVAKEFKVNSIHGLTLCITRCVEERFRGFPKPSAPEWIKLLDTVVTLNQDIILLMLDVLAGGKRLEDCPSFADMGMALEGLVSSDFEEQEEIATLSPEFQLLLSWCWINLKNSCSCLGEIISCSTRDHISLLDQTVIENIGKLFLKVLTTCRHRGAIEGCRTGFSKFINALLSSKIEELYSIPKIILSEVLQSLSTNSLTASVSRRSAGLPIIIQSIVSNETRICTNRKSLLSTVDRLYEIASAPLPADHNQQRDLSQSHALNILKVIFCDASLSSYLMPHLSKITVLVIKGFDSPSWAIRNAATQLISTLVTRIFGQKNVEQGSMSLEEFQSAFPSLFDFAFDQLQSLSKSKSLIKPSLYLILTLFSNLSMSPSHQHHQDGTHETLQKILLPFSSSPVYSLRKLSAQAYVSLCPLDHVDDSVKRIIGKLSDECNKTNIQHGYFLCLQYLVSSGFISPAVCQDLLAFLSQSGYLDEKLGKSSFTAATVMIILKDILMQWKDKIDQSTASKIWSPITSHVVCLSKTVPSVQLGNNYALTEALTTLMMLTSAVQRLYPQIVHFFCSLLSSNIEDVRHSALLCICQGDSSNFTDDLSVQQILIENLSKETSQAIFTQSCQLLARLHLNGSFKCQSIWKLHLSDFNSEQVLKRLGSTNRVQLAVLLLEGMVIYNTDVSQIPSRLPLIGRCCEKLVEFSNPCVNEDLRLSATSFLKIAGKTVVECCCAHQNEFLMEKAMVCFVQSLVYLLQDSESDVRKETAVFISELRDSPSVHADLAWELLSDVISEKLWWNLNLLTKLVQSLFAEKELSMALQHSKTKGQRLFEPETESTMSEPLMLKLWTFHTLEKLMNTKKVKSISFLTSALTDVLNELTANLPCLVENTEGKHLFNCTTTPNVMSALLGIILIDRLCGFTDLQLCPEVLQLHSTVKKVLELSNIHPFLREPLL